MSNVISAVFDDREQARSAVAELRSSGVPEDAISIVGRPDEGDTEVGDKNDDASKGSIIGAVAGGRRSWCASRRRSPRDSWSGPIGRCGRYRRIGSSNGGRRRRGTRRDRRSLC